jgi:hypothetical protein
LLVGVADLFSEGLASLAEATKWREWPRRRAGKRPHISCLIRWVKDGVRGVKLETVRCGGTLCTSKPAVGRFLQRLSELDGLATPKPINPAKAKVEADAILEAAGV